MTIEEIGQFFKDNKDDEKVKAFVANLAPGVSAETVKPFLETDEGRRLLQPITDKRVTEALKTYKEGHFDEEVKAEVAKEILKRNPKETDEQKRLHEIEGKLAKSEAKGKRDELLRQGMEVLTAKGIPSWWVEQFSGNTIEEFTVFAEQVQKSYGEREEKVRNELLGNSFKPGGGNGGKGATITMDKAQLDKMTSKERFEHFKAEAEKREAAIASSAKP